MGRKSSQECAVPTTAAMDHQPPLPVRIALVSTTTALATPTFPALGFLYLVLRVTVPDADLRKAMEGKWGTLMSFTTWTLLPTLYHGTVASLILPFALGNAVVAGGVYGLVELACGGPNNKVMQTPWIAGTGIGATVGYVAPHYVYGPIMENLYAMEGMSQSVHYMMSFPYAPEVSVATGAVAGMLLHPMLYYPMNGVSGVPWGYFSGTALAAVTSALVYVYYGRKDVGLPVPEGSFVEPSKIDLVNSIIRFNNTSGHVETYSLSTQRFIGSTDKCLEGQMIAESSRSYAQTGKVVFDDRLMAFMYNYWDANTKTRYPDHVLDIKTRGELQKKQYVMALADATVASIIEKGGSTRLAMEILATIDDLSSSTKRQKKLSTTSKCLKEVSVAIELLMIAKLFETESPSIDVPALERYIRKRYPELTIYTSEEQYRDESIESQLRMATWKGPELSQAMDSWRQVHEKERYQTWRNRVLFIATGVLVSVAGTLLQGNR